MSIIEAILDSQSAVLDEGIKIGKRAAYYTAADIAYAHGNSIIAKAILTLADRVLQTGEEPVGTPEGGSPSNHD